MQFAARPHVELWLYADVFGNRCPRFNAPAGARSQPRIGRILIARGRDAADIPLVNSFGPHILKLFRVWTDETSGARLIGEGRRPLFRALKLGTASTVWPAGRTTALRSRTHNWGFISSHPIPSS